MAGSPYISGTSTYPDFIMYSRVSGPLTAFIVTPFLNGTAIGPMRPEPQLMSLSWTSSTMLPATRYLDPPDFTLQGVVPERCFTMVGVIMSPTFPCSRVHSGRIYQ